MKGNYLKSYFKSFGLVSFLVLLFALLGMAGLVYVPQLTDLVNRHLHLSLGVNKLAFIEGALLVLFLSVTVIGMTGLKNDNVGFVDLLRVESFFATVGGAVMIFMNFRGSRYLYAYLALALLLLIQIIIRFIHAHEPSETSLKGYFSALCSKYNPIAFVLISGVLSVLLFVAFYKNIFTGHINLEVNKMIILGGISIAIVCAFIPAFDSKHDVCLSDLVSAIGFLTTFFTLITSFNYIKGEDESRKILAILFIAFLVVLLIRALTYTKPLKDINPKKKAKSYFASVYSRFDAIWQYLLGFILLGFVALPLLIEEGNIFDKLINKVVNKISFLKPEFVTFGLGLVAMVLLLIVFLLILFGKNKNSKKTEKVDGPLIPGLVVLAGIMPIAVLAFVALKNTPELFNGSGIILWGSLAFAILVGLESLIVLIKRIRSFEPVLALDVIEEETEEALDEETEEALDEETEEIGRAHV